MVSWFGNVSVWKGTGLVVLPDGFHYHTDECVGGGVCKKDEIDTERVAVSEGYRAGQAGESPRDRLGGYLDWGDCVDVE